MEKDFNITHKVILICFTFFILSTYLLGFYLNENSAGGAIVDFEFVKINILTFKNNNFLEAIKLTASNDGKIFQSTRAPGFYIFNKYLNPFALNIRLHQAYLTFLSLLIPILLFFNLKLKYNSNNFYLFFLASIVLLSPYLRSSAFWGIEENLGIIVLAISTLFFQLYLKTEQRNIEIIYLFFLAIFSSLCVYFDQKLVIIPVITLTSILFSSKKKIDKIILILLYSLLSLPFIYLIKLWGNIVPSGDAVRRQINSNLLVNINFHHFGLSISIIAFYLFPIIALIKDKKEIIYKNIKDKTNLFLTIIFFVYLIYFLFFFKIESMFFLGGGVFLKATKILTNNFFLQKIILTFVFIVSWMIVIFFSNKIFSNYLILLIFPICSLLISPALFQEYFDPFIYFLILVYLKNKFNFSLKKLIYIFLYFLIFLCISILYYKNI